MIVKIVSKKGFWLSLFAYGGSAAIVIVLQQVYGFWLMSIGIAALWWMAWIWLAAFVISSEEFPHDSWKALGNRFPSGKRVTMENAYVFGIGTFCGNKQQIALMVNELRLIIGIWGVVGLRPRSISVPWQELELDGEGIDDSGERFASMSFKCDPEIKMTVPWKKRWSTYFENLPHRLTDDS